MNEFLWNATIFRETDPLLLMLLLKIENDNVCPMCGNSGKAVFSPTCDYCDALAKIRDIFVRNKSFTGIKVD